jgi:prepilin-type N-terminal cleavage/methylation domain-containing protein
MLSSAIAAEANDAAKLGWRRIQRFIDGESGFTLIELLVVLATLGIVLGGLVQLFTSATRSATDQANRVGAQQEGRLALTRLARETHCASALTYASTSVTLTLPYFCPTTPKSTLTGSVSTPLDGTVAVGVADASSASGPPYTISIGSSAFGSSGPISCTGKTATSFTGCTGGGGGPYASGVRVAASTTSTWCAVGGSAPYSLKRFVGAACTGTGITWANSLFSTAIFTSYGRAGASTLATLNVSLVLDKTPADTRQRFTLNDAISLRNSGRP